MTLYNVHIYREMRLTFEADTPENAALIARDRLTEHADGIEDCNGEDLGALIDIVGDENYEHFVTIDFEAERLRKSAAELLAALQAASNWTGTQVFVSRSEIQAAVEFAIAKAMTGQPKRRPA